MKDLYSLYLAAVSATDQTEYDALMREYLAEVHKRRQRARMVPVTETR